MNTVLVKIKRLARRVRGRFARPLPTGMGAFHAWAEALVDTYPMPTQDLDSIKFGLAATIMHLGPDDVALPDIYFVKRIRSGAAKQVAGAAFYEIKIKHEEAEKAAASSNNVSN